MKKVFTSIILLIFTINFLIAELDYCDKTVLVVLKPEVSSYTGTRSLSFFEGVDFSSVENIFQITCQETIDVITSREGYEFRSIYRITLSTHSKANVQEAVEIISSLDGVESASPNYYLPFANVIPNDPQFRHMGGLYNIHGINALQAWNRTTGSHNVRVGVIDSGISVDHSDLEANRVHGFCCLWF